MRCLAVLAFGAGLPLTAYAGSGDLNIQVEVVVKAERISPAPKTVHPRSTFRIVLHPNGMVDDSNSVAGKFPRKRESSAKLGVRFKVIDDHTLAREYHVGVQKRTLTIQTSPGKCVADLKLEMPEGVSEFETITREFGTMGRFRDAEVESLVCKID